jgi:Glycosyl hydrolase family 47
VTAWSRRSFLAAGAAAAAMPPPALAQRMPRPKTIAAQIRDEFLHAWMAYKQYAWGYDEVLPLSGKPKNFFMQGHSFGLSIIEAMDTLYVMELDDELNACITWLKSHLDFNVDGNVQMFEAVIRMVAGLLTGFYASGERFLFDGARDLAERLLPCFEKSPTGAPYRYANLKTGAVSEPKTNLAEIGSNILEFGELSRLTGNAKYVEASIRAYEAIVEKRSPLNLLGTEFDIEKGQFIGTDDVAPDEPVDSFYEYLWGAWGMLGNTQARDWYFLLTDAIMKYKPQRFNGRLWFRTIDYRTAKPTSDTTSSNLAAFYAELAAKSGYRQIGEAFYDSWTSLLDMYGLIPEVIDYGNLSIIDAKYWMRPEYVNSAFDLWFLTREEKYRTTAYRYFEALRTHCRTTRGYTVITDVRARPMAQGDYFPAYAFSENFKYLYLIFTDSTDRFDGSNYYLNTEGKILRGLRGNGREASEGMPKCEAVRG